MSVFSVLLGVYTMTVILAAVVSILNNNKAKKTTRMAGVSLFAPCLLYIAIQLFNL